MNQKHQQFNSILNAWADGTESVSMTKLSEAANLLREFEGDIKKSLAWDYWRVLHTLKSKIEWKQHSSTIFAQLRDFEKSHKDIKREFGSVEQLALRSIVVSLYPRNPEKVEALYSETYNRIINARALRQQDAEEAEKRSAILRKLNERIAQQSSKVLAE